MPYDQYGNWYPDPGREQQQEPGPQVDTAYMQQFQPDPREQLQEAGAYMGGYRPVDQLQEEPPSEPQDYVPGTRPGTEQLVAPSDAPYSMPQTQFDELFQPSRPIPFDRPMPTVAPTNYGGMAPVHPGEPPQPLPYMPYPGIAPRPMRLQLTPEEQAQFTRTRDEYQDALARGETLRANGIRQLNEHIWNRERAARREHQQMAPEIARYAEHLALRQQAEDAHAREMADYQARRVAYERGANPIASSNLLGAAPRQAPVLLGAAPGQAPVLPEQAAPPPMSAAQRHAQEYYNQTYAHYQREYPGESHDETMQRMRDWYARNELPLPGEQAPPPRPANILHPETHAAFQELSRQHPDLSEPQAQAALAELMRRNPVGRAVPQPQFGSIRNGPNQNSITFAPLQTDQVLASLLAARDRAILSPQERERLLALQAGLANVQHDPGAMEEFGPMIQQELQPLIQRQRSLEPLQMMIQQRIRHQNAAQNIAINAMTPPPQLVIHSTTEGSTSGHTTTTGGWAQDAHGQARQHGGTSRTSGTSSDSVNRTMQQMRYAEVFTNPETGERRYEAVPVDQRQLQREQNEANAEAARAAAFHTHLTQRIQRIDDHIESERLRLASQPEGMPRPAEFANPEAVERYRAVRINRAEREARRIHGLPDIPPLPDVPSGAVIGPNVQREHLTPAQLTMPSTTMTPARVAELRNLAALEYNTAGMRPPQPPQDVGPAGNPVEGGLRAARDVIGAVTNPATERVQWEIARRTGRYLPLGRAIDILARAERENRPLNLGELIDYREQVRALAAHDPALARRLSPIEPQR